MSAQPTAFVFRDRHFAPSGDTLVCVCGRDFVEKTLGVERINVLFKGFVVYTSNATKQDYVGVWGRRHSSRFRRMLREHEPSLTISRARPVDVRLRLFNTMSRIKRPGKVFRRASLLRTPA
jgi:hypothetical protein